MQAVDIEPLHIVGLQLVFNFLFDALQGHFLVFFITRVIIHKKLHLHGLVLMDSGILVIIGLDFSDFLVFDSLHVGNNLS